MTIVILCKYMQIQTVSKSKFKAKALEYFRLVESKNQSFMITHNNTPVAKVVPIKAEELSTEDIFKKLGDAITYIGDIESPVGVDDWKALK